MSFYNLAPTRFFNYQPFQPGNSPNPFSNTLNPYSTVDNLRVGNLFVLSGASGAIGGFAGPTGPAGSSSNTGATGPTGPSFNGVILDNQNGPIGFQAHNLNTGAFASSTLILKNDASNTIDFYLQSSSNLSQGVIYHQSTQGANSGLTICSTGFVQIVAGNGPDDAPQCYIDLKGDVKTLQLYTPGGIYINTGALPYDTGNTLLAYNSSTQRVYVQTGPSILNASNSRIVSTTGSVAYANNNLTFDDSLVTLTVGPQAPNTLIPDLGLNNLIVCADNTHSEVNTVCFDASASRQASLVQHFARGTIASPASVVQDDILGQYFVRGLGTGASGQAQFMNTAFINVRADYNGTSSGCVGGRLLFRTRGNADNSSPSSYGYPRLDITNPGVIRFYDTIGNPAYSFPQVKPNSGDLLVATGSSGALAWQPGKWQNYTGTFLVFSGTTVTYTVQSARYTVIGNTCMGNAKCNISNIVSPVGSSNSVFFKLPINASTGSVSDISIGSGTLSVDDGGGYPDRTVTLVSQLYTGGNNDLRLWYSADNSPIVGNGQQTYLENDYLPTLFGPTTTWNGYSGGVNVTFNFTYEIDS